MSKKVRPKKKRNSLTTKRVMALIAEKELAELVLVFKEDFGSGSCLSCNMDGTSHPVSKSTAVLFDKIKYKWKVTLIAACTDDFNNNYIKTAQVNANQPYTRSQLSETTRNEYMDLKEGTNPNHLVKMLWLATVRDELTEDEVITILRENKAWESIKEK